MPFIRYLSGAYQKMTNVTNRKMACNVSIIWKRLSCLVGIPKIYFHLTMIRLAGVHTDSLIQWWQCIAASPRITFTYLYFSHTRVHWYSNSLCSFLYSSSLYCKCYENDFYSSDANENLFGKDGTYLFSVFLRNQLFFFYDTNYTIFKVSLHMYFVFISRHFVRQTWIIHCVEDRYLLKCTEYL